MTGFDDIKRKLADRWEKRSPKDIANQFSKPLFGGAGEWDLPPGITPKKKLLYLAVGIPDTDSLPKAQLQAASDKIGNMPGDLALRYGFGQGPNGIRAWLAGHRNKLENTDVDENWFQMTNGSSGAIDLIVRSLVDPGDVIIAENPTYMGTLHNFRGVGAEIQFVSMDNDGLDTDKLDSLLTKLKQDGKSVKTDLHHLCFSQPNWRKPCHWLDGKKLIEIAYKTRCSDPG